MTANRYKRPSARRELTDAGTRIPTVEYGNPRPTFRAAITDQFNTITLERRGYFDNAQTDTVFWDYWDDNYNRKFFEPLLQASGIDAGRIGSVELLIPGIYAVRATIDWQTADFDLASIPGAFSTWIGSNYDDGGVNHIPMDINASDIIGTWVLDQHRMVWPAFTGAESTIEITVSHDRAGETLYIPGGFAGFWAQPPMLWIVYLGGLEGDPVFFSDV